MVNSKNKQYNKKPNGEQIVKEYKAVSNMKIIDNIWEYSVGMHHSTSDKIAFEHPAVFPEKLAEDHILSWSKEGDLVFDPFTGSGTTGKMSLLNKRRFLGIEIDEGYMKIAKERMEKLTI